MVGVSNHWMRKPSKLPATRFFSGFALGGLIAALFLTVVLFPLSSLAALMEHSIRVGLFAVLALSLGILDLVDRTPSVRRQTPQRLSLHSLAPGRLGLIYGIDLGLHATTQATNSLVLIAVAGAILFAPHVAVFYALGAGWLAYTLVTAWLSAYARHPAIREGLLAWRSPGILRIGRAIAGGSCFLALTLVVTRVEGWW